MPEFVAVQLEAYPAPVFPDIPYPPRPLSVTLAGNYVRLSRHSMPVRTIDEYVLLLCTEGEGWVRLGSMEAQAVRTGELLFLPENVAQSYGCVPGGYWSYLWIHIAGDGARYFYDRFRSQMQKMNPRQIPVKISAQACMDFKAVVEALKGAASFTDLLRTEALAYQFLCDLISDSAFSDVSDSNEKLVQAAMKWLETTTQYHISLDELSALFGVSKYHLIRLFKRYEDITPMDYFQQVKMKKSCVLLADSALSVTVVSERLGYSSPYHFSKMFKLFFGISPRQFKKIVDVQADMQ